MTRIQILELPMIDRRGDGMETPFALIVDQAGQSLVDETGLLHQGLQQNLRELLGARAVLVFEDTVDIPANGSTPAGDDGRSTADAVTAETIDTPLAALVQDTLGIFLGAGQPVPAFALDNACRQLTKSEAAREYLNKDRDETRQWAAKYDTALTRVRGLSEAPGVILGNRGEPVGDSATYLLGYKMAIRDAKRAADFATEEGTGPDVACYVCGRGDGWAVYRNYKEQAFCWPCADCACGQDPCVRTGINAPLESAEDEPDAMGGQHD